MSRSECVEKRDDKHEAAYVDPQKKYPRTTESNSHRDLSINK